VDEEFLICENCQPRNNLFLIKVDKKFSRKKWTKKIDKKLNQKADRKSGRKKPKTSLKIYGKKRKNSQNIEKNMGDHPHVAPPSYESVFGAGNEPVVNTSQSYAPPKYPENPIPTPVLPPDPSEFYVNPDPPPARVENKRNDPVILALVN